MSCGRKQQKEKENKAPIVCPGLLGPGVDNRAGNSGISSSVSLESDDGGHVRKTAAGGLGEAAEEASCWCWCKWQDRSWDLELRLRAQTLQKTLYSRYKNNLISNTTHIKQLHMLTHMHTYTLLSSTMSLMVRKNWSRSLDLCFCRTSSACLCTHWPFWPRDKVEFTSNILSSFMSGTLPLIFQIVTWNHFIFPTFD